MSYQHTPSNGLMDLLVGLGNLFSQPQPRYTGYARLSHTQEDEE